MSPPIRTDPITGKKLFNTRAAQKLKKGIDTGYAVITDPQLTTLPEAQPGKRTVPDLPINSEGEQRYKATIPEFVDLAGTYSHYAVDIHSAPPVPRDALHDECDILIVGAGFAGLMLWHQLRKAGFTDVRICEKGGDVGGTWYWNRYPGIACDIESYSYLPLLDETGYIPKMKFASGDEILSYCQLLAEHLDFYDHGLFHTTLEEAIWDDTSGRWTVKTDRGDCMRVRFIALANGILSSPRLSRIKGMEAFQGKSFHSSRWDHTVDLAGKRVGIIGTGATAVQLVPELAKTVGELFLFQRTPATVDIRGQRKTTNEEREMWAQQPGWSRTRRELLDRLPTVRAALQADDDILSGKQPLPERPSLSEIPSSDLVQKALQDNLNIMERFRARVDSIVEDPVTADALKPYYSYFCKRPTFHDEFYPAFNLPNVHLLDTAPNGVTEITERGVVACGKEYPLDVLVYATGFKWLETSTFSMIKGRGGRSLKEKWDEEGTRTFLGIHSHDFPNLFIICGPQGFGGSFNFTVTAERHTDYVANLLEIMRDKGFETVDVCADAENSYAIHCREADLATSPLRDCRSYYNGDGAAEPGSLTYYGGPGWSRRRDAAFATLEPYIFDHRVQPGAGTNAPVSSSLG